MKKHAKKILAILSLGMVLLTVGCTLADDKIIPLVEAEIAMDNSNSPAAVQVAMVDSSNISFTGFIGDATVSVDGVACPVNGLWYDAGVNGIASAPADLHILHISYDGKSLNGSVTMPESPLSLTSPGNGSDTTTDLTVSYTFATAPAFVRLAISWMDTISDEGYSDEQVGATSGSFTIPAGTLDPNTFAVDITISGVETAPISNSAPGSIFTATNSSEVSFTPL